MEGTVNIFFAVFERTPVASQFFISLALRQAQAAAAVGPAFATYDARGSLITHANLVSQEVWSRFSALCYFQALAGPKQ